MRKCLHLYHDFIHPVFGFMHARIQTWFPFSSQICLNGREWLARQMDHASLGYERKDNAFVRLEDADRAQRLMNEQVKANFSEFLDPIAARLNPAHREMFGDFSAAYYWSVHQSEWATDIMFQSPSALARIYPQLVQHGIRTFGSPDIMRFLGRRVPSHGNVHRAFAGEIVSDLRDRPEGIRIKQDRPETGGWRPEELHLPYLQPPVSGLQPVLNDPRPFLVFRRPEGKPNAKRDWLPLRRGIADIQRRAELSHKVTERYLDAHASVSCAEPLGKLTEPLCQPTQYRGQRVRGLNPLPLQAGGCRPEAGGKAVPPASGLRSPACAAAS